MSRYRTRRGWTRRNRTSTRPVPAGQAACLAAPRSPLADVLTGPGASSRAGREWRLCCSMPGTTPTLSGACRRSPAAVLAAQEGCHRRREGAGILPEEQVA